MRWLAKIVLIMVLFPSPVWPVHRRLSKPHSPQLRVTPLTDKDDIELETTLEELVLDLAGDGLEADIGVRFDLLRRNGGHGCEVGMRERDWGGRRAGGALATGCGVSWRRGQARSRRVLSHEYLAFTTTCEQASSSCF
jgi:hypothetical protein